MLLKKIATWILLTALVVCAAACRADDREPPSSAGTVTAVATAGSTTAPPPLLGSPGTSVPSATRAPTAGHEVTVGRITIGGAVAPTGVSLIVASDRAQNQSERMPTRIDRVTFDAQGMARVETLLEAGAPGAPRSFHTIVADAGGDVIVVTSCTRGDCALMSSKPSADAQTTLVRSEDGGRTWREWAVLDGAYSAMTFIDRELVLNRYLGLETTPQGVRDRRELSLYPSGEPVHEPLGSAGRPPFIAQPGGELLWFGTDSGVLLRNDGSVALTLDVAARWTGVAMDLVLRLDDGRWVAVLSGAGCDMARGTPGDCLVLFDRDGALLAAHGGIAAVYDLHQLSGRLVGLVTVPGAATPSFIDALAGVIHPIAEPSLAPWAGRDRMRLIALAER